MKEFIFDKKLKFIYGLIAGIICISLQGALYFIVGLIVNHSNYAVFVPKVSNIDDFIPFISIFIIPYILSYAYWVFSHVAAAEISLKDLLNLIATYLISNIVACIIFLVFPTYMDRIDEGIYNRDQNNFFDWAVQFIYDSDGKEKAYNLFPSTHCMLTTVCFLATFRKKELPLWYRISSFVLTVLIYLSTVFIKQHYFFDIVGGIVLGFIVWFIIYQFNLGYKMLYKFSTYLMNIVKEKHKIIENK